MKKPSRNPHSRKGKPGRASDRGPNSLGPNPRGPNHKGPKHRGPKQSSDRSDRNSERHSNSGSTQSSEPTSAPQNRNKAPGRDRNDAQEKYSRANRGKDQREKREKDPKEYTRQERGKNQGGVPGKSRGKEGHGPRRRPRMPREVSILFEDDALIVLNKPAGLLAVPIKGSDVPSALSLLIAELKPRKQRALIVHRIDRFASGILLFAKTDRDRDSLIRQFLAHTPVRGYLAVVRGQLPAATGPLIHYFKRQGLFQQLRTAKDPDAARAELRYYVDRVFRDATLVKVELVTGLQNQIRAQFSALGHPIIGDRKYEPTEAEEHLIDRVALHAAHLEFTHPRSGERIKLDCAPPQDFQRLIRGLEHSGRPRR
jgi:23S rRNA pseudouridine1911/1915/1917 synthase